jgi:hypothetical protein
MGSYNYDPKHPPLGRVASAIGLYWDGVRSSGEIVEHPEAEGNALLLAGGHYWRNLTLARLGVLPFFVLACTHATMQPASCCYSGRRPRQRLRTRILWHISTSFPQVKPARLASTQTWIGARTWRACMTHAHGVMWIPSLSSTTGPLIQIGSACHVCGV